VRGFDEGFRLYFEDVDLCVRLQRRGWRIMFDPDVRVSHHHRASSRQSLTGWSTRQHVRSAMRFYRRYPRHVVSRGCLGATAPKATRDLYGGQPS